MFARLNGGAGAFAAGIVCLVLVGAGIWIQQRPSVEDVEQQVALKMPSSDPTAEIEEAPREADTSETANTNSPTAPAFDEVRREADGMTVIAGRATPGSAVSVMQNGVEVAQSTADPNGKFATLAIIPPDGEGHVLSLSQTLNGTQAISQDEIILAPRTAIEPAPAALPEEETAEKAPVPDKVPDQIAAQSGDTQSTVADPSENLTSEVAASEVLQESPPKIDPAPLAEPSAPVAKIAAVETPVVDPAPVPTPVAPTATPAPAAQAPQAVAVLKSTEDGVELLNTPSPQAMTNVAIDTISYSGAGEVQLAGRAQSDTASVRVYLDNAPVVNLAVDAAGRWRGELPDVDEGIYTLRVDEVSSQGTVTSRVETPFKREDAQVLADATAAQSGPVKAITVQKGATLWAIARERYGDGELYVRVFEANASSIRDPDLIYPGQIFDLPD
ncbi:LysM domain protein [Sulfitobacter noctilucae]|nr:LysM domain protein [Sulfitobacter noctilucae]